MFAKIMCPVDLAHLQDLKKALEVAGRIAKEYGAEIVYCGVAPVAPGGVSHTPEEYAAKLKKLAEGEAETYGVKTSSKSAAAVDPTADLNKVLRKLEHEVRPDLIVMSTHAPNFADQLWSSHGSHLAQATDASIFLVRGNK